MLGGNVAWGALKNGVSELDEVSVSFCFGLIWFFFYGFHVRMQQTLVIFGIKKWRTWSWRSLCFACLEAATPHFNDLTLPQVDDILSQDHSKLFQLKSTTSNEYHLGSGKARELPFYMQSLVCSTMADASLASICSPLPTSASYEASLERQLLTSTDLRSSLGSPTLVSPPNQSQTPTKTGGDLMSHLRDLGTQSALTQSELLLPEYPCTSH